MTNYISSQELKDSLNITSSAQDSEIDLAVQAASRLVEEYKRLSSGRTTRYYPSAETRYYSASCGCTGYCYCYAKTLEIDDAVSITSVKVDRTGNYSYSEVWTAGTHYVTEPANNHYEGKPIRELVRNPMLTNSFPPTPQSVQVTGTFGWTTAPALIKQATTILAARLYNRRNAPFGILVQGIDSGVAVRLPRTDPDVAQLLDAVDSNVPRLFA